MEARIWWSQGLDSYLIENPATGKRYQYKARYWPEAVERAFELGFDKVHCEGRTFHRDKSRGVTP